MNNIRFAHYRLLSATLLAAAASQVEGHSGATVAYTTPEDGKPICYAVAFCHPNDNYCKKLGRVKAAGRLKSDAYREVTPFYDTKEFLEAIDKEMDPYNYVRKFGQPTKELPASMRATL